MAEFYEIELKEALRPAITYAISDLKNPDARKAEFSKTITLPSSKKLDKLFNHIFEINVETLSFNPNKRLEVEYFADEQSQLKGYLKLDEIVILDNNDVNYKVSIFGKNGDLFSNIGEKELTDLSNWSKFDHDWSRVNVLASWDSFIYEDGAGVTPELGRGYIYPLIEYGLDQFQSQPTWYVKHLFPAIYVKEYWDRIFEDAGKTYTSNFINSDDFKRLLIPFNGTSISLSSDQINDRALKVDTASLTLSTSYQTVKFSNEVLDDGGNYDPVTGIYTVPENGFYDFASVLDLRCQYTNSSGSTVNLNQFVNVRIGIFVNGVLSGAVSNLYLGDENVNISPSTTYDTGTAVAYPSDAHRTLIQVIPTGFSYTVGLFELNQNDPASNRRITRNELFLELGDEVEIKVSYSLKDIDPSGDLFVDSGGTFYSGTINATLESGKLVVNVTNPSVAENGTIDFNQVIPRGIKQKDFLKSLMNMFRLEIQPDNDNPDNFIIEPYEDFYTNDGIDWSQKLDVSQDLVFEPMGLLEASEYLYKYKDDKDYYNETYKSEYNETYGQRSGLIDNDFVKKLHTTELIFSPTPSVQYPGVDLILPTIIKNEDTYKQTESNIRILQYGGLLSTSTPYRILSDYSGSSNLKTEYPYCGHFDDPYDPTTDINFGLPRRLYYDSSFADINYTNNNLFNKYHLPFLKQVSQRDSKLVSGWFYLKPSDIATLDFRKSFFFNNAYHRLIKIENYDPNKPLTKCYFLKILYTTPFEGTIGWTNGGDTFVGGKEDGVDIKEIVPTVKRLQLTSNNYANITHEVDGKNNYVDDQAKNIKIQGDNNYIGANVSNVNLTNSNSNNIIGGVTNVTLINTDGLNVTESNVVYINGRVLGGDSVTTNTSNFTAKTLYSTYEIDTSAGAVQVTLDSQYWNEGDVINFKKITNDSNKIEFKIVGGGTVDYDSSAFFKELNTNIPLQYNGNNNWIVL